MYRCAVMFMVAGQGAAGCGEIVSPESDGPRMAVCGDGAVEGDEICDAGTVYSNSMPAGVCRPDCAGTVQQRFIGVTSNLHSPAQGGVAGVDAICRADLGSSYKALLVDGVSRIASVSPYVGDGQVGWVLQPFTRYSSAETGKLVFITGPTALLGVVNGQPASFSSPIRAIGDGAGAWTGAAVDWTSGPDCLDWSSNVSGDKGLSTSTDSTSAGKFPNSGGASNCTQMRRFFCVQQ